MASSLSVFHPTSFGRLFSRTFFCPRPLSSATSVVSFQCLSSSSSTAAMTFPKITMKTTSSQTNATITSYNAHSLKAAIFKTLALKFGNEMNNETIAPSTRHVLLKVMYSIFLLSSKKITVEQYCRLHFQDPPLPFVKPSQTTSLFLPIRLLTKTISLCYMQYKKLSTLLMHFFKILSSFKNWPFMTRPNILLSQTCNPSSKFPTWLLVADSSSSLLTLCSSIVIFFAPLAVFMSQFHLLLRRLPSASFNFFLQTPDHST